MYKMIALDLDGTLNNDEKKITEKTREALLSVQQHGVTVVLASGRQAPGLHRIERCGKRRNQPPEQRLL